MGWLLVMVYIYMKIKPYILQSSTKNLSVKQFSHIKRQHKNRIKNSLNSLCFLKFEMG